MLLFLLVLVLNHVCGCHGRYLVAPAYEIVTVLIAADTGDQDRIAEKPIDDVVVALDAVVDHLGSAAGADQQSGSFARLHSGRHLDIDVRTVVEGSNRFPRDVWS